MDVPDVFPAPGTRYHMLLTTNEPPEDSESTFIRSVISRTTARLASLEDQIYQVKEKLKHLEDELASLSNQHTQHKMILSQHKVILSPLRRMPPELLSEIFSATLPTLSETWKNRKHYMDHSSWVLSHVSSRWRMLSLSTPPLWSSIVINYNDTSITHAAAPIEAQLQ
ncbi:hypothetical protein B0H12DRAFT_1011070, partial [Mycena haematopus]